MKDLRQAAQQALEVMDDHMYRADTHEFYEAKEALRAALAEPEQEPVAVKHMMRWVDALKRLSDDGQHMNIPGLSSGACWELAAELEQFIKSTAPTPRKPLTDEQIDAMWLQNSLIQAPDRKRQAFARAIERAHGIKEQEHE